MKRKDGVTDIPICTVSRFHSESSQSTPSLLDCSISASLQEACKRPRDSSGVCLYSHVLGLAKLEVGRILGIAFRHNRYDAMLLLHAPEAVQEQLDKDDIFIIIMNAVP